MTNPTKISFKTEWFAIFLVVIAVLASFYFWPKLPAQVPIHWNISGQPDGYSSPLFASFLWPSLMVIMYLFFLIMPYFDPRKDQYAAFAPVYHRFKDLLLSFIFIIFIMTDYNALGYNINIGLWVPILVGLLFIAIGLLLRRVKANWFLGIRTPWTLSSEAVWEKTHRLSVPVFTLSGILIALVPFFPPFWRVAMFILAISVIIFVLPIYSYLLYAKEKKEAKK